MCTCMPVLHGILRACMLQRTLYAVQVLNLPLAAWAVFMLLKKHPTKRQSNRATPNLHCKSYLWLHCRFPLARRLRFLEAVLHPGDAIFFPACWAQSLDESVSVTCRLMATEG